MDEELYIRLQKQNKEKLEDIIDTLDVAIKTISNNQNVGLSMSQSINDKLEFSNAIELVKLGLLPKEALTAFPEYEKLMKKANLTQAQTPMIR